MRLLIKIFRSRSFRVIATVLSLLIIFQLVSATLVLAAFEEIALADIPLPLTVAILVEAMAAARLMLLLRPQKLVMRFRDVLSLNFVSRFYSLWLPGGNVTAFAVRVAQITTVPSRIIAGITAVAVDRIFATVTLLAFGIICLVASDTMLEFTSNPTILFVMLAGGLVAAVIFVLFLGTVRSDSFAGRRVTELRQAMAELKSMSFALLLLAVCLSFAGQALGTVVHFSIAQALGIPVDFWTIGWFRMALMVAVLVPVTVGGLGIREGSALLLAPLAGISADAALAYALLTFAVTQLFIGLLGGLIAFKRPRDRSA